MPSPFPGMNPYLENPELWPEVHSRLIVAIADALTPQLMPKYRAAIDQGVYDISGDELLEQIYDRAGYGMVIDYGQQPAPALDETD